MLVAGIQREPTLAIWGVKGQGVELPQQGSISECHMGGFSGDFLRDLKNTLFRLAPRDPLSSGFSSGHCKIR